MRSRAIPALFFAASFSASTYCQNNTGNPASEVLQKVVHKIDSYKSINYTYYRSVNYFSENYHNETIGTTFLDFMRGDTALGFRYQLEDKQHKLVYNGSETFTLNKKNSTITVNHTPNPAAFASLSFFLNSLITLKGALPVIIADPGISKTLSDTILSQKSYHLVSIILQNKTLNGLGRLIPTSITRNFLYRILIDKESFLPHSIIQSNDAVPNDYMLTSFSNFGSAVSIPDELSWYYSTYTNDFKPISESKLSLIRKNTVAPDWQSGYFNSRDSVALSKLKGQVVLLEFWLRNCGYCIAAVPKLNSLVKKFKAEEFRIIGINMYDGVDDMNNFYQRTLPDFQTVYDSDGRITQAYGVGDFPKVVLVDKKGIVVYAGDLNLEELERLVQIALQ